MLPLFTYPLAFWGLLAVPVLVGIYILRNRFRRQPVSSLMLWLDLREARQGGTRVRRPQTPLLFLLELLAILLLVLAAVDPQVRASQGARPLVVVLDDSFSMLAGGDSSAREKGLEALRAELRRHTPYSIRFILAGEAPQVLGEPARTAREALALLDGWRCRAPASCLQESLTLGAELGGDLALLLVITDRAPPPGVVPEKGRLAWWAFGSPRPNRAIVNAARTARDGADRVLLEVANLAEDSATTNLRIETADGRQLRRTALELKAGETRRIILQLQPDTPAVRARLDDDDLAIDNEVTLLPTPVKRVGVAVEVDDKLLRPLLLKALRATRSANLAAARADLVFTDKASKEAVGNAWLVRLLREKGKVAYTGPFVLDRAHPLTEGLSLRGVIWGAGKGDRVEGAPVIMAGNVPLLTDTEVVPGGADPGPAGGRHELRWRLRPELSTLQDALDWPILIANIVDWRAERSPGLRRSNVRLGERATLVLRSTQESVELVGPGGESHKLPVQAGQVSARGADVGVYEFVTLEKRYAFSVNALSREESDLRECESGRWGDWLDETSLRLEYRSVAWLMLLLAVGVLSAHLWLVARQGRVGP
jgi:hypothetical protein